MKIAVTVYRRPDKSLIHSRVVLGDTMLHAAGFYHGWPAYGFADHEIIIICGPKWEAAVSEFLASHHEGPAGSTANGGHGAIANDPGPRAARPRHGVKEEAG